MSSRAIEGAIPPQTADDWDRVGLIAGDPAAPGAPAAPGRRPDPGRGQGALDAGADLLFPTAHAPRGEARSRPPPRSAPPSPPRSAASWPCRPHQRRQGGHRRGGRARSGLRARDLNPSCRGLPRLGIPRRDQAVGGAAPPMTHRGFVRRWLGSCPDRRRDPGRQGPGRWSRRVAVLGGSGTGISTSPGSGRRRL